mgnify:FL=1|tara:strand:- start:2550 stop:3299 length:750 start_codon:yes stop_codon:yes gene_type:complete
MATYESRRYAVPIDAPNIADGSVSNTEFQHLDGTTSDIQTQIDSKLTAAGAFTIATGMILPWAAALADIPTGYLGCTGANVSRSTYSALFALIGTTHGAGDGNTTFGLPNFQNRMAIGKSGTYALGATGGSTTESYTPAGSVSVSVSNHTLTTAQIPSHSHFIMKETSVTTNGVFGAVTNPTAAKGNNGGMGSSDYHVQFTTGNPDVGSTNSIGSSQAHNHGGSGSFSGSTATLDILNPYISINFIIKT